MDIPRTAFVQTPHDLGIEAAAGHQAEELAAGPPRIERYRAARGNQFGQLWTGPPSFPDTGEQVLGSERQDRQRRSRRYAIGDQAKRAIAAGCHHRPQPAFAGQLPGPSCQGIGVGLDRCRQSAPAQLPLQVLDQPPPAAGPGSRIGRNQDLVVARS